MAKRNKFDEPVMSDLTILVSVEDLISIALGPPEENTVNFKLLQTILHILARQMRLLETKVDIKISELPAHKKRKKRNADSPTSDASPERSPGEQPEASDEELTSKGAKKKSKKPKTKDEDVKEKPDKMERKSVKADGKISAKSTIKQQSDDESDSGAAKSIKKKSESLKQMESKVLEKMTPAEKETYMKQAEEEENIIKEMSPKEKENYLKDKQEQLKKLEQMSPKEKEQYLKERDKDLNALKKMSTVEKENYFKEKDEKRSKEKKESKVKGKEEQKSPKESSAGTEEKGETTSKEKKESDKQTKQKGAKTPAVDEKEDKREKTTPREKEEIDKKQKKQSAGKAAAVDEKEDDDGKQTKPKKEKMSGQEKEEEEVKQEKTTPKEKEAFDRKQKQQMSKVGIVGPDIGTAASARARTSIEVVTLSQFKLLEAEVERLKTVAAPLPVPALPTDRKLKDDLVKGSASLTDTMQAMQVSARVQAAETGLARMAGLITQLAASGALPGSLAAQLDDAVADMKALGGGSGGDKDKQVDRKKSQAPAQVRKSVAIDATSAKSSIKSSWTAAEDDASPVTYGATGGTSTRPSSAGEKRASAAVSVGSRFSRASVSAGVRQIAVTRTELDDAIQYMKEDMMKQMQQLTYKAASSAETAAGTALTISEKMEIAMKLNSRISDLYALTTDYAEQLSGFDAGLTTQMQSFQEQIGQMRGDLKAGLVQLEAANNNAETAAVKELTERFMELQGDQEASLLKHHHLTSFQGHLDEEVRGLVAAVEMLREQKADRDEVWDGLRDKADLTRLNGLLTEGEFARSRALLDSRLDVCYEKFDKQEAVWMRALQDLTEVASGKAEVMRLYAVKDDAQEQLRELQEKVDLLAIRLGEPKAAILTRLLSKDGSCGACRTPALMEVGGPAGLPPYLPPLRPPPDGEPCEPALLPFVPGDDAKAHICNRWVGGSHTLVPRVAREVAPAPVLPPHPVKRFAARGTDGKMYHLEENLQICAECNKPTVDEVKEETGAGDVEDMPLCICCESKKLEEQS